MLKSFMLWIICLFMVRSIRAVDKQCQGELELAQKMFKLDVEMQQMKDHMRRLEETVIAVLDHRWKEMTGLRDEVRGMTGKVGYRNVVAFTANEPTDLSLEGGQDIIFAKVQLDEGGGYDNSTGVFTAPIAGLYQFTIQACNAGGTDVAYAIMHEGKEVALGVQFQPVGSSCSSTTAYIVMKKTEKVWIRVTYPGYIQEDNHRRAAFMGVLLQ